MATTGLKMVPHNSKSDLPLTFNYRKIARIVNKRKTINQRHRKPVDFLEVNGNCCWKVLDTSGRFCDFFKPGESRKPSVNVIATVEAGDCSDLAPC